MLKLTQTADGISFLVPTSKKQTNRQRLALKAFAASGDVDAIVQYLSSLSGKRKYVDVPRLISNGRDILAEKDSNSVADLFRRITDLDRNHTPLSTDSDWIGVEIECIVPESAVGYDSDEYEECSRCDGAGRVNVEYDDDGEEAFEGDECPRCHGSGQESNSAGEDGYRTALASIFKSRSAKLTNVKDDGSLDAESGYFSAEITVLTRLSKPENLRKVCSILNEIGAKVNRSCGLHVHLDARHYSTQKVKSIGGIFSKALPVLLAMVPETRRTNRFCRPSVSALRGERYHAVNLTSFRKYKTIEVRLHSSTTDFNKIINWATLLSCIASTSRIPKMCNTLNELTDFVYLPETLIEYVSQRTALFSPDDQNATSSVVSTARDLDSTSQQIGA